ncbi:MAG: hypothetical protein AB2552_21285 [Candidatus Thiodiazotropha endolucinida]
MNMSDTGIDLEYRPAGHFWPLDLEKHLLSTITGDLRRQLVREKIEEGDLESVPEDWLVSRLDELSRTRIGNVHPAFMGGEYLPDPGEREIEIARITIASTTQDVTAVRATQSNSQILYRVVDEYDGETLSDSTECMFTEPLTLGQLEVFFNRAWPLFDVLDMNFRDVQYDIDSVLDFVMPDSEHYPEFGMLYRYRIIIWCQERRRGLGLSV